MNSLRKNFSLTGWKTGWAIIPPHLTWGIRQAHTYLTLGTSTDAISSQLSRHQSVTSKGAEKRLQWQESPSRGIVVFPSRGAYFVVVDHTLVGLENGVAFCEYLIKEIGVVALVPEEGKRLFRFAVCKGEETLSSAIERMVLKLKRVL